MEKTVQTVKQHKRGSAAGLVKRWVALLAVLCLMVTALTSCGGTYSREYKESKNAFEKTTEAYLLINQYSKDLYDAWNMGINDKSRIDDEDELEYFSDKLYIDYTSLRLACGSLLGKSGYEHGDWKLVQKRCFPDSFFSACVAVVVEAYSISGTTDEITGLLNEAKESMKTLDNKYADYTHYPSLKAYFSNTLAFFDFCKNPEGSFDQVVETFNQYRNNARLYYFDLNYVFSDSIEGMKEMGDS